MAYLGVLAEVLLAEVNQVVDGDLAAVVDVAHLEDAPQQLEGVALGRRRRRRGRRRRRRRHPSRIHDDSATERRDHAGAGHPSTRNPVKTR